MMNFTRCCRAMLALCCAIATLLPAMPVTAQGDNGMSPTDESARSALFLPLTFANTPVSQPIPNPLTVAVTVDESRVATGTIPIEGGTLAVTAKNGVRYVLTVPADALLSDQEMRMMPLAAVEGMPMTAGMVAGVHLEPEGLQLMQAATLTVEGAPGFADGLRAAGFGYRTSGSEFHLRPIQMSDSGYTIAVNHFSGYGVTAGTNAEMQNQVANHVPTALDDAARQRLAAEIGTPDELQAWFEDELLADLEAGRDGDTAAMERSIYYFQAWLGMIGEYGLEAEFAEMIETGWKHLLLSLANNIESAYAKCKAGDASQVVRVLRWSRIVRMLPTEPRREWISDNYMNTTMKNMAQGCATFELDFDSQLAQDVPGVPHVGQAHDSHVRAENARVQFNLETRLVAPAEVPMQYVSFNLAGSHPECSSSTVTTNGTFRVVNARINLNYGWGEEPKFTLNVLPQRLDETITHHCPGGVTQVFEPIFWYTGLWMLHWDQIRGGVKAMEFTQWHYVGKSLYAEMIIDVAPSEDTIHYHGTTWMVLAHAPE